jgi:soluble lytic murein transglycosylase-like protein
MSHRLALYRRRLRASRLAGGVALLCASCVQVGLAQIYVSSPQADGQGTGSVVLSNFASDQSPLLLIAAPAPEALPAGAGSAARDAALPCPQAGTARAMPAGLSLLVAQTSAQVGVPVPLLTAVMAVESNFSPRAVSAKGAQGLMQLLPATARRFGARNAMDAADNLRAGASYLRWLGDRFQGDLPLVLAAYNAGEAAVARAGNRVPAYAETQAYVPRVMARLAADGAGCAPLAGRPTSETTTLLSQASVPAFTKD